MNITDRPWKTWIGHAVQGFVIGAVFFFFFLESSENSDWLMGAVLCLAYHFGIREFTGIKNSWGKNRALVLDGVIDFVAPFAGLILFGWVV